MINFFLLFTKNCFEVYFYFSTSSCDYGMVFSKQLFLTSLRDCFSFWIHVNLKRPSISVRQEKVLARTWKKYRKYMR